MENEKTKIAAAGISENPAVLAAEGELADSDLERIAAGFPPRQQLLHPSHSKMSLRD